MPCRGTQPSEPFNAGRRRSIEEVTVESGQKVPWIEVHPVVIRVTHWLNVVAMLIMVTSGWRIYNAAPVFPFKFPPDITLGGWLGGAIQWHFAAMWLLAANGLVYLAYGIASGHFRKKLWPISPGAVTADILAALRGRLAHDDLATYNAAQRAAYTALILTTIVLVLSGLAVWKSVQLQWLAAVMGGYDGARVVHFVAMALAVLIVVAHVVMVALVPKTFPTMITGRIKGQS
jgi:thiosulfate reductase cytochrome b subunit